MTYPIEALWLIAMRFRPSRRAQWTGISEISRLAGKRQRIDIGEKFRVSRQHSWNRLKRKTATGTWVAVICATALLIPLQGSVAQQSISAVPQVVPRDVEPIAKRLAGAPRVTLKSGLLQVTVALPDPVRGFYRSTRFDWSGMITGATYRKAHFYGPWVDGIASNVHDFVDTPDGVFAGERSAGTGAAEEFANRDGETVPGYNAAPVGGTFIKIGVGRLRKDDAKPYDHFNPYSIVDRGKWTVRVHPASIEFVQNLPPDATGYGFEYEKKITLAPGGTMTITHRLRNIGTQPIRTQMYNHNLARFGNAEIGPGVEVRFPFLLTGAISNPRLASVDGNVVRYLSQLMPGDRVQLPPQPGDPSRTAGAFKVIAANGSSITVEADSPLVRTVLWSMRRTVAVETFVAISVAPGEEQRWSWHYTYDDGRGRDRTAGLADSLQHRGGR